MAIWTGPVIAADPQVEIEARMQQDKRTRAVHRAERWHNAIWYEFRTESRNGTRVEQMLIGPDDGLAYRNELSRLTERERFLLGVEELPKAAAEEVEMRARAAFVLLDWSGVRSENDRPLEYSPQRAMQLFQRSGFRFYDRVCEASIEVAREHADRRAKDREALIAWLAASLARRELPPVSAFQSRVLGAFNHVSIRRNEPDHVSLAELRAVLDIMGLDALEARREVTDHVLALDVAFMAHHGVEGHDAADLYI